jgi:hypothetical protein
MSSLFTLLSSLVRPTAVTPRVTPRKARTRLNLETLEDRRLLSGFHGSGHGEVEPVEIEHTPLPVGTVAVTQPINVLGNSTITIDDLGGQGEVEPGDTPGVGEVEPGDTPGQGEVEPGDTHGIGEVEAGDTHGLGEVEVGDTHGLSAVHPSITPTNAPVQQSVTPTPTIKEVEPGRGLKNGKKPLKTKVVKQVRTPKLRIRGRQRHGEHNTAHA